MVPLVYVLLSVFEVQRASFGVTEAARQAGRAYATADDPAQGRARAAAAAELAMRDQGSTAAAASPVSRLAAGRRPGRGDGRALRPAARCSGRCSAARRGGIPVDATHVEVVDRFRSAG
jgi:hypothetical protein